MRVALLQMTAGVDPAANAATIVRAVAEAAEGGATFLFTPEMSGALDRDRARSPAALRVEAEDPVLHDVQAAALAHDIWVSLGSLAVLDRADEKRRNRSFVIGADGAVKARYDKIHLFDVDLPDGQSWRESATYAAGQDALLVQTPLGLLGLSICYDLRFSALFNMLSKAGADVIAVPAAFTVPTGEAHWHTLLRARAIETQCFVVAAAQTGQHEDGRETFGHSLVVDPWGRVLLDAGTEPGLYFCDLDLTEIAAVRARIPVHTHHRPIGGPLIL